MTTLRDRCKAFLSKLKMDGILRQGSPVDDLIAFVLSEQGRAADEHLSESLPLVLYFSTDTDRDEFIEAFREAKPNLVIKKMP